MVEDINFINFDDQQLKAIIWCMQAYKDLDTYEQKLLTRLEQIQLIRLQVHSRQGEFDNIKQSLKEM